VVLSPSAFRPPWYLRSGHIQTLLTAIRRPKTQLYGTKQFEVPIGEAGATYAYWDTPSDWTDDQFLDKPPVVLLHGLGSSHSGTYMTSVASHLIARGHCVLRVDLPGSGPSLALTPLPAHAGCDDAIASVLDWASHQFKVERWRAAGFSLGGNILLRLLYKQSVAPSFYPWTIERAVAVAPPIDLRRCCEGMNKGVNRFYARYFLKILNRELNSRASCWPEWKALKDRYVSEKDGKLSLKTIQDFDNLFTSVMAGFRDANEYYATASSKPLLGKIKTPIELLCDRDDPIVPAAIFDGVETDQVRIHWTSRGGHLGYLQRSRTKERSGEGGLERWADSWITDRLTQPAT
jgi:uncharacterized protein